MCWLVIRFRGSDPAFIQSCNILCLIYFSPRGLTLCPHEVPLSPKLHRNVTGTSTSGLSGFHSLALGSGWTGRPGRPLGGWSGLPDLETEGTKRVRTE